MTRKQATENKRIETNVNQPLRLSNACVDIAPPPDCSPTRRDSRTPRLLLLERGFPWQISRENVPLRSARPPSVLFRPERTLG
jgi:hypothetical protein